MSNPHKYYFSLADGNRPQFAPLKEEVHDDFHWLTSNRARSRQKDVIEVIDTVVIHATAGYATQHAVDHWKIKKASAHWIVPDEDEPQHGNFVWATVAEAKAAYHVRDEVRASDQLGTGPNTNNRSLGIEIVNTQDVQNFSDPFSDWQVVATAQIILYAWAKYPNLTHVISHAKLDPDRRKDPGNNFPWEKLKNMVLSHEPLPSRDPLVNTPYNPPEPQDFEGNCCGP